MELAKYQIFDRKNDFCLAKEGLLVEFGAKAHVVIEDEQSTGDWNSFSMVHAVELTNQNRLVRVQPESIYILGFLIHFSIDYLL